MSFWGMLAEQWQQQSIGEVVAVVLAIAYVWLAAEESVWCWPAGFLSTGLYAYIYFDVTLFFQMILNVYYMGMAVWGFICWRKTGENKMNIVRMTWQEHMWVWIAGVLGSAFVFVLSRHFFDYDLVLLDISLTVFSLITTYLTVTKRLENWFYWSAINFISLVLLYDRGLHLTMLLMLIYIGLAIRGLIHWLNVYNRQHEYEYQ